MTKYDLQKILTTPNISKASRVLIFALFTYQDKEGSLDASYKTLSTLCGLKSHASISKAVKELSLMGVIETKVRAFHKTKYTLVK